MIPALRHSAGHHKFIFQTLFCLSLFTSRPQKYGGATAATVPAFRAELDQMLTQRYNNPSIIQWEARTAV